MKSGVLVKIHESADKSILAVADKELVGKTFEEVDMCLNVSERFYKGEELSEEEVIKLMKNATNMNIIGKKAIAIGIKAGIITEDNVIKVKGIPHAIIFNYGN
ncbi:DUF424 family protein [Candidatus Woesearchaeota archaeon]|nr:DUF424 family protein [Candidatus Woesearchaeota archaeon]